MHTFNKLPVVNNNEPCYCVEPFISSSTELPPRCKHDNMAAVG